MSRSSTKRSFKCAQGNLRSKLVREANAQVSRMVILALLSISRRCYWALEQPSSSVMELSSAIRHLKRLDSRLLGAKWSRTYMHMGSYGAHTKKPSFVYSVGPWSQRLLRTVDKGYRSQVSTATIDIDESGQRRVTGNANLKGTQAYTRQFGEAVLTAWQRQPAHDDSRDIDAADTDEDMIYTGHTNWHGCDFASCVASLAFRLFKLHGSRVACGSSFSDAALQAARGQFVLVEGHPEKLAVLVL